MYLSRTCPWNFQSFACIHDSCDNQSLIVCVRDQVLIGDDFREKKRRCHYRCCNEVDIKSACANSNWWAFIHHLITMLFKNHQHCQCIFGLFCMLRHVFGFLFVVLQSYFIVFTSSSWLVGHWEERESKWWGVGLGIYLKQHANDLRVVKLMPLPPDYFLLH